MFHVKQSMVVRVSHSMCKRENGIWAEANFHRTVTQKIIAERYDANEPFYFA